MGTYTQRAPLPPKQPSPARTNGTQAVESAERRTKRPRSSASDDEGQRDLLNWMCMPRHLGIVRATGDGTCILMVLQHSTSQISSDFEIECVTVNQARFQYQYPLVIWLIIEY